ncbi:MAG: thiazole synthase [Alphaproteobacteria bacterium]
MSSDQLILAGEAINSRLLVGTAGYPNQKILLDCLKATGTEIVTISIRRINLVKEGGEENILGLLGGGAYRLLPNTAGCTTVKDAVFTAELAREALGTNWVKLELIGDLDTLYPDSTQLLEAATILVDRGFEVFPYCSDDPVLCQKLADIGCVAVMPLGSLIGSGQGINNPAMLELICERSSVPVILDAGVGTASDAALAMELGCSAVLLNTAIAKSLQPLLMARAMRAGVEAGRLANLAGRIPKKFHAEASSPRLGLVGS